jgi:hypothetical protein
MKLHTLLAGAAVLAMSAPAFAQNAPMTPAPGSQPPPASQPATPMPPSPTTTPPPATDQNSPTPPDSMSKAPSNDTMATPTYGKGWNASKCEAARKGGKTVDPANCPPEPK